MAEQPDDVERDLAALESELKALEAEYTMYFAGRLKRPPVETEKRVAILATRLDRRRITNYATKFRFTTLQTRFAKLTQLWERALRAREEGRAGPFAVPAPATAPAPEREPLPVRSASESVHIQTFSDPAHETEKLQQLYAHVVDARRQTGQPSIPFDAFAALVEGQVSQMQKKGRAEVAFRVAVKDGKVELTARGFKEKPGT